MLEAITSDALPVRHGFFTRKGGASSGIFAGLNCGTGSSDQSEIVAINRARVAETLGDWRGASAIHMDALEQILLRVSEMVCELPQLREMDINPLMADDDIEKEKKVILEEIQMVEDTPDDLVHEIFAEGFWSGHPLGRPHEVGIAGQRHIVRQPCASARWRPLR